jgi:hypothetical protein
MTRRAAIPAICAVIAAGGIAGCSDSTHGDQQTLKLTQPGDNGGGGSGGPIGNPKSEKKIPPGAGFAFSQPYQDSSHQTVGALDAACIATQPSGDRAINGQCTATATVPGGTLALSVGGKNIGSNVSGAIVGGTGKYAGATGTFTSAEGGGKNPTTTDTFEITLP